MTISMWFSKVGRAGIAWVRYHISFSKAALFISVLVFSHSLAEHAVRAVMISHITENWKKEHLPTAAAIVNVQEGVSAVMVIVVAHISDAYTGRFKMVAFSSAAYLVGLVLLWLADRRLTQNIKVWILYVPVLLIALGEAGRVPSLKALLADQLKNKEQNSDIDENRADARTKVWWRFAWFLGSTVVVFTLSDASWAKTFKVSAIVMGAAYLIFWCGITSYYCNKPTGSPLTTVFRVFKVAILKRHLDYPLIASQFFQNHSDQLLLLPHIPFFRWLDKAAIVESSSLNLEEQEKKGTLCTVAQVKDVKHLLKLVPMWTTFLAYSLVEATGSTFFIEQSSNMDDEVGNITVPIISFFVIKSFSSFIISYLYESLIPKRWSEAKQKHPALVRIGIGFVCSILCCITAWQVEVHRLNLVKKRRMSIFWLAPQFCLLGLMEGLAGDGLLDFFYDQVPESMKRYGPPLNDWILGIGDFLSILCVFASRRWFGETINSSHLDEYYRMLAMLTLVNLCIYGYVLNIYACKEAPREEVELDEILEDCVTEPVTKPLSTENHVYYQSMNWTVGIRSFSKPWRSRKVGRVFPVRSHTFS